MKQEIRQQIARVLVEIEAVGFAPNNPIRFKSGILSPIYIDNRSLPFHPSAWHSVIEGFSSFIHASELEFDIVAGVAVGGVPHSAALAYTMQKPSVFIRKETKEHGTQKLVEGGDVTKQRVLLIEDLVTTGGSSLSAVKALRQEEATISDMFAIVSYGFRESVEAFEAANVKLHTLTDFNAILCEAEQCGHLAPDGVALIKDWFDDPYAWGKRHGY